MPLQKDIINKAVAILQAGGLIGLPTETVYGLAADARNPVAVARIFAAKGRPADHPLIVHLASVDQLPEWARDIPPMAKQLANAFWPGPLTLILKKQPGVLDLVTGSQDTVGVRVPVHPVAVSILREFGGGIAAPSANRFGRISPTTAEAVAEELGPAVDLIVDGGACEGGIESTIVDCTTDSPVILRPGMISMASIEAVLHEAVQASRQNAPRVSGSHCLHYSPETMTRVFSGESLLQALQQCGEKDFPLAVLLRELSSVPLHPGIHYVAMPKQAKGYAHDLYQTLRTLDHEAYQSIWIEAVPEDSEWDAIRDRLRRASASS